MSYIGNEPTSVAFLTDTFSGNGSTTAFTLSQAPATTSSIIVAVSGVLQDPSTYSISGTTLTFSGAPPTGSSNISVRFLGIPASGVTTTAYRTVTEFTATSGQTTFSVPSYTAGFIDVYRNGVMLGSADYTATNGTTVVLASGATAGDLVEVISFYVSSVLNAIPSVANAVTDAYINTGAVTTTKIADANVTQAKLASGVAGNGPAFSATLSSNQTVSSGVWTKAQFNTEQFDTNTNYDSSTNYRFTPTVAGYYQINLTITGGTTAAYQSTQVAIYKNGSQYSSSQNYLSGNYYWGGSASTSAVIYFNGSTDYVESYGFLAGSGTLTFNASDVGACRFSGSMIRTA